jgi:hypothetical protein
MYDSREDTEKHIQRVQDLIFQVRQNLHYRGSVHDQSKLHEPEKDMFDHATEQLRGLTYGSEEYRASLKHLGPALAHHYAHNTHHPEHYALSETLDDGTRKWYTEDGEALARMSLFDVIEMLVDWKAASERHENGNIYTSIDYNVKRFGIAPQLAEVLRHTAKEMGW